MKLKLICCTLLAAMLLCACQASVESPDVTEDPPALEQSEPEETPADGGIEQEEPEESEEPEEDDRMPLLPPAPPVCELDFTETQLSIVWMKKGCRICP